MQALQLTIDKNVGESKQNLVDLVISMIDSRHIEILKFYTIVECCDLL